MVRTRRWSFHLVERVLLCSLLVPIPTGVTTSCTEKDPGAGEFETYLARASEVWRFQGSYLVAKGDSTLLRGSRGYCDPARRRAITPETRFLLGSLTKPFTAIAVLQLVEEGLISLDSTVCSYLPYYPSLSGDTITVHDLLCHRSGIPDLLRIPEFAQEADTPITPAEMVELFAPLPLDFPPACQYTYSSSNYVLLALIIEAVARVPWQDRIRDNICEPLGMQNTGVFPDYPSRSDFARGQVPDRSGHLVVAPPLDLSRGYGAGSLASTVDDLLKLHNALSDTLLLEPRLVDLMLTQHSPAYGYGWIVDDFGGHRLTAHGGGTPGFVSVMQRWPDDSLCVIVLSNTGTVPVHTIANALAAIALGERYELPLERSPAPQPAARLEEYVGQYRLQTGEVREVRATLDRLLVRRGAGSEYGVLPLGDDSFYFVHDHMTTLSFIRNEAGDVTAHVIQQAFDQDTARFMDDVPSDSD